MPVASRLAVAIAVIAACAAPVATHAGHAPGGGIWKAAVPAHAVEAAFEGHDPLGLSAGKRIRADCSLNWIDPDTRERYCFASGTSLLVFLEHPKANIASAAAAWSRLGTQRP
ncbi:hypothetical protein ACQQ2N_03620 [Dokdonella sp. MW10]|uniref:hypothetical protein n=1 Tax=Dokdonella sp. MW10 TaxID=2992926 RepID=UPI003F7D7FBF